MTTIVSAFISDANSHRSSNDYFELGKHLLEVRMPKVIFLEKKSIEMFHTLCGDEMTIVVEFEKHDLLFECNDSITLPVHRNIEKDTKDYLQVQCNKTNWLNIAAGMNPFESAQFVWIDFGIFHIFQSDVEQFQRSFDTVNNYSSDKVRIPRIWNLENNTAIDEFNRPLWFFAGGVVGGSSSALQQFHSLFLSEIQDLLEKNMITWEVNIWYLIWKKHPELFDPYSGSHDTSILEGY